MKNTILPEFQNFLLSRSLVPDKKVSFYAHWVSKFLAFSNRNDGLAHDLRVRRFLSHLKLQKNVSDWQIRQANEALQLYINHFLDGDKSEMHQAIRIRHYSYRTERSYIDWAKRFFEYTSKKCELKTLILIPD